MTKILFIIQSYPSVRSANVLCDEKIMAKLIGKYEVHALTYQFDKQPQYEMVNGVHVHRFRRSWLWDKVTWAKNNKDNPKASWYLRLDHICLRLKQVLTVPAYPNYEIVLSHIYAKAAIKLHEREGFDIVFAEHNGNDTVYAGMKLKQYDGGIKFLPVFWDALSGASSVKYLPKSFAKNRQKAFEKRIVESSNKTICMNSHKEHMLKLWGNTKLINKIVFLDIPYFHRGIDNSSNKRNLDSSRINIVFAGSMWRRDVIPFVNCVYKTMKHDVRIWIYTSAKYHELLYKELNTLEEIVTVKEYLPHEQLEVILSEADIFLNFGVDNPNAISGKIFEYMGYGKPIISTYKIDNEACIPYISSYELGFLFNDLKSDDEKQIKELCDFIKQKYKQRLDYYELEKSHYFNTPDAYIDVIDSL